MGDEPKLALTLISASRRGIWTAFLPGVLQDRSDSSACSEVAGGVL